MKRRLKRLTLFVLGRRVTCELCGETLFRAKPLVRRGRVKLQGAEEAIIRVEFDSMNTLAFRHVEAERCPALRAQR